MRKSARSRRLIPVKGTPPAPCWHVTAKGGPHARTATYTSARDRATLHQLSDCPAFPRRHRRRRPAPLAGKRGGRRGAIALCPHSLLRPALLVLCVPHAAYASLRAGRRLSGRAAARNGAGEGSAWRPGQGKDAALRRRIAHDAVAARSRTCRVVPQGGICTGRRSPDRHRDRPQRHRRAEASASRISIRRCSAPSTGCRASSRRRLW
jgi:hypothetical protein